MSRKPIFVGCRCWTSRTHGVLYSCCLCWISFWLSWPNHLRWLFVTELMSTGEGWNVDGQVNLELRLFPSSPRWSGTPFCIPADVQMSFSQPVVPSPPPAQRHRLSLHRKTVAQSHFLLDQTQLFISSWQSNINRNKSLLSRFNCFRFVLKLAENRLKVILSFADVLEPHPTKPASRRTIRWCLTRLFSHAALSVMKN